MAARKSGVRSIGRVSIRDIKGRLNKLPLSVADAAARELAPALTSLARQSFDSGENVYGDPRPRGVGGDALKLLKSGDTRRELRFVQFGTIIRARLGTPYAKYLIGKYKILPIGDRTAIPARWVAEMNSVLARAIAERGGRRVA